MGYTHYWAQKRAFTKPEWSDIKQALTLVLANTDCPVAGPFGEGWPEMDHQAISFNGRTPEDFETMLLYSAPNDESRH